MYEKAKVAWAKQWLKSPKTNFINGTWQRSQQERSFVSTNPADQSVLTSFAIAGEAEVTAAAQSARTAFLNGSWSKMERRARGRCLNRIAMLIREHAEELATLETLDNGKIFEESLVDDIPESADVFDYYAGWVDKYYAENCPVGEGFVNYTVHEPVGVCGLIVPWNFPLLLACWKLAPALAMGNTVVIKPSEYTSLTMVRLFEILEKADLPKGVLNLVLGDGETGNAMTSSHLIDKISFTGSTAVGKRILGQSAASNLKRVTLELGGKSPNIIFDDVADVGAAMDRTFTAMFSHKGEKCSEPTKLFVHRKHYEKVVADLAQKADAVRCGDPFNPASKQGPQCNENHFNKIMEYIAIGKQDGSKLVAGGSRDGNEGNEKGFYIRPTIFADVNNRSRLAQEEIFGPVLVITPFKDEDEVVAMANDTTYGLAAGLWTADVSRAHRVAGQLDAGMVFVNRYGCYDFASPFGGFKQSGWGKEMAVHSLESYTKTKSIWIKV